ncbi:MAG: polysaccharide deacetylase family protein [Gammaproteobacteria bacterium]
MTRRQHSAPGGRSRRQQLTALAKQLLYRSGLIALARRCGAQHAYLPVVRYHAVHDAPDYCPPSIAVAAAQFDREIAYLAAHYTIITVEQAVSCLRDGRPFPRRAVAITFDDGYRDNLTVALPILARHGASAMFYVTAGPVIERTRFWVGWLQRAVFGAARPRAIADAFALDLAALGGDRVPHRQALVDAISAHINRGGATAREAALARVEQALGAGAVPDGVDFMLDADDLRALAAAGMEIGSHTVNHAMLTGLDDAEAQRELSRSRALLEGALDAPVTHLAYPNGPGDPVNFDARVAALAAAAGYRSAVTSRRGAFTRDADPYALPRHAANHAYGTAEFAFKLEEQRFSALLLG